MTRTEYGFRRTTCPCRGCVISCQHLPGPLAPPDLDRMARFLEYTDLESFARENLLAAEGPRLVSPNRKVIHLPTLVPATRPNGHCKFLQDNRCTIHPFSPYGCAFLDAHMSEQEKDNRSRPLHADILHDLETAGPYSTLWRTLRAAQLTSPPIETRRYRLSRALKRERLI